MATKKAKSVTDNPLYHDTWCLLKKYRDVVWSLELSVQQVRNKFQIEFGKSVEDFLESIYLAGADLSGTDIEHHARCIQRSAQMIKLVDGAMELLHTRHKDGEAYYWLLYYTYTTPQQPHNAYEIIDKFQILLSFYNNDSVLHRDLILRRCGKGIPVLEFQNMIYR